MSVNQSLSLFIPHVFSNITEERIRAAFESVDLGNVKYVDFVEKTDKNGKNYNTAYIHFNYWHDCETVANFQSRVVNPDKVARIVYDDPWYWIVLPNTSLKPVISDEEVAWMEQQLPYQGENDKEGLVSADYARILEERIVQLEEELSLIRKAHVEVAVKSYINSYYEHPLSQ